jgi:hypothetical protein
MLIGYGIGSTVTADILSKAALWSADVHETDF